MTRENPQWQGSRSLLAVTDDELERLVLAHSPKFQALLDRSRRQTGGIPHAQFWRKVKAETHKGRAKSRLGKRLKQLSARGKGLRASPRSVRNHG